MKHSLGFIGGGRITKILLQGFINKNVKFEKIVVADTNTEVLANLKKRFPDIVSADAKSAASQDVVFLALHPPMIMDTLELIKNNVKAEATVISLAPKINMPKLALKLGHVKNLARLIPNATSYINEGFNPVTFATGFDQEKKVEILSLLKNLGQIFEVSEEKLESYAIMPAMLPTYFWFQWREISEMGEKIGLSGEESKQSIYQTIVAALHLLYKSGLTPAEVIDLIPVKPIGDHEPQITEIYNNKLIGLFEKIKPS
ncbi:MAG: NAD(P)-binding domain-containing protein [Bacteroidales bacterium]|jgi:pyrroline-5-carboxylate reductase|nr:NAD(P)-binding domain-containing protein [Bacteroidales bacterium]